MKIGLVGLGKMGSAIASRLAAQGHAPLIWDRDQSVTQAHGAKGFQTATDARAVAAESDVIISIISDDNAVRTLFNGERGFLSGGVVGKLFVEMTTLQPMTARELATAVEAKGARLIDSPVLGSIPTAREGKLLALAGGTPEDLIRARAVHDHLARRVVHMGSVGSGSAMKLSVNLGMAAYLQSLSEALSLGQKQGLDLPLMLDVLGEAPTANAWLAMKKEILKGAAGDMTMDIRTMRKDVMSAVATGALTGVAMPVSAGALSALCAAVASGWGEKDLAELPRFFRESMLLV
jgi:3-hydroxyisobutyrate dehydrogenase